ncbi:N(6)-adenine-specific methyltransferase METTL4-like isoform X1 [Sceloporus undulatus]|uniref:N(6)-adenine-specific methyltransferase METTL4-like isoform X1 n=1 Tax=Sceloporus undulatus TaxID=8520 RepID=UPI001C4BDFFC|nr:N(6)-adenine-specific methyltransferase METTL4-like isoform X1 [Sceloporus undulatus]XP_042299034.1 N(6)-adenine-specific methyltransferase METTL4-like isoform X1 [Sceloporus undulatus]XP_042299035.1 N(6)-adenine-specific methyltransferase METTL4-like isoform X1 [Sceloporus undulatus]
MSVVCSLSAGWILDHLSFINKSGYQICHSQDCSGWVSLNNSLSAASSDGNVTGPAILGVADSCGNDPVCEIKSSGEKADQKMYMFREEFFNVLKPHIAINFPTELQQRNSVSSLENGGSEPQERAKNEESCIFTAKAKKKRKRSSELNHGECDALEYHLKISGVILDGTRSLVQEGFRSGFLWPVLSEQFCARIPAARHHDCGLAELCEMAKQFHPVTEDEQRTTCTINEEACVPEQVQLSFVTENTTNYAKIITLMGQKYLFPPRSAFLLSDISFMQPLLDYKKKFGIIVIDPPWENKSVKRSNRYRYLSHWQIKQIPVPALAAPDCIVVTWVTNRQKHLRFVKSELYPYWSVHGVVEWFWVKITRSGEFVFPLDSVHKKPYEVLVVGRVQGSTDVPLRISEGKELPPIPAQKLIVSVPCTLHSHKPPLAEILKEYANPEVECLELFARNLQPGWTSWGNEVLRFQHMDYFTPLQNKTD